MAFSWGRPWLWAEMPFLSRALAENPNGLASEDGERAWTYEKLSSEAEEIARRLRTLGMESGHVVALAGRVNGDVLAALHGIWKAGGTVAPLNDRWTRAEKTQALGILGGFSPALTLRRGSIHGPPARPTLGSRGRPPPYLGDFGPTPSRPNHRREPSGQR